MFVVCMCVIYAWGVFGTDAHCSKANNNDTSVATLYSVFPKEALTVLFVLLHFPPSKTCNQFFSLLEKSKNKKKVKKHSDGTETKIIDDTDISIKPSTPAPATDVSTKPHEEDTIKIVHETLVEPSSDAPSSAEALIALPEPTIVRIQSVCPQEKLPSEQLPTTEDIPLEIPSLVVEITNKVI